MKFARLCSILTVVFYASPIFAKGEATGHVGLEYGKSAPQSHLIDTVGSGETLRLRLFGGAKIQQKGVGAVGLGLDLSYSDYELKNNLTGHYRRVVWDWFFLPLNIGFLEITPGLTWVITDVHIEEYDVRHVSIRPGGLIGLGFRIGILPYVALTGQVRAERVWEDKARAVAANLDFDTLTITGDYISATVGIMAFF
ncbi:MAG: hypothetical protein ACOH5I_10560 [Oligoflexus sp.]